MFRSAADGRTTRAAAGHMAINATWPSCGASAEYPARKNPTIREKIECPFIFLLPSGGVCGCGPIFSACAATITQPCRARLACGQKPHNERFSASAHCAHLELAEAVPGQDAIEASPQSVDSSGRFALASPSGKRSLSRDCHPSDL